MNEDPRESAAHTEHGKYLTAPVPTDRMPQGIPYIVGNEAAERFSFYGMRTILVIFMTHYLLGPERTPAPMDKVTAMIWYHQFLFAVYFFPLLGALISDIFLGKYRTILILSVVYCFGHLALALDHTTLGLGLGLALIAVGSGGIKPCVSANVGDQFGTRNQHLLEQVFGSFYFAINAGAFASTIMTPWLLDKYGPDVAFGVPGVLMLLATIVFWLGRYKFVHVPPGGMQFVRDLTRRDSLAAVFRLLPLYLFTAVFWSLYDQSGSAWVLQAESMDRHIPFFELDLAHGSIHPISIELDPAQVQAINPILIMLFIPLFAYVVYPAIEKVFRLTPLRKIGLGFCLASLSFLVPALIEQRIAAGGTPHIAWQVLAFVIITAAEMMVSVTCLEFSYTQAPKHIKSLIMSVNMLAVSLGNAFTAAFNEWVQGNPSLKLSGVHYYWAFASLMLLTAGVFVFYARGYREHVYLQEEIPAS